MRLSFITLLLSFLSLLIIVNAKPRRDLKRSSVLSSRQYRIPRDLLDICINADVDLLANASQLLALESILGPLDLFAKIHLCLCLKDLDIYLDTNDEIQALVGLLGRDIVRGLIKAVLDTSPEAQRCTFPQNAHHTCNGLDTCHYACDENYVRNGDKCVCASPYISCNGVCDLFPQGCSSAVPRSLKARKQSQASCKPHESVCGIKGRKRSFAFKCINTSSTKDSCGGCMVSHPFHKNHGKVGRDCTAIPYVQGVACSKSRCVVQSCKAGWVPTANRNECVVDPSILRPLSRRASPPSANVTTSGFLTQVVVVVDTVLDLNGLVSSSKFPPSPSTNANIWSLLSDINGATSNLIASPTIRTLLLNSGHLLSVNSLLKSSLTTCACVGDLELACFMQELDALVAGLAKLKTWCLRHSAATTASSSLEVVGHDRPIIFKQSDLLAGLAMGGKSGGVISRLLGGGVTHNTGNLLQALGLGLELTTSNIDSELLGKITTLAQLAVKLQADSAVPAPVGHSSPLASSPIKVDLLTPILQATASILNSTTVSSVVVSLNNVIGLSGTFLQQLDHCDCVDALALHQLYADLKSLLRITLDAYSWCHDHPIVPGNKLSTSTATAGGDVPVVIGLSDLLGRLSLGLLGPIQSAVEGVGAGVSDGPDCLLDGLRINPHTARRDVAVQVDVTVAFDSSLLSHLELLINLVAKLQGWLALIPPANIDSCVKSPHTVLLKEMVEALTCITPSMTTPALLTIVDRILVASVALQNALQPCATSTDWVENLFETLALITEVTLELGNICRSGSASMTIPRPPTTSRSLVTAVSNVAITNWPTLKTTSTVSIGFPAATRRTQSIVRTPTLTQPISPPTSTSTSNDEVILTLNQLLSVLGLRSIKAFITVDGLGREINDPINSLLDDLGIGPHGLRRRAKRVVVSGANSNTTVATDSKLQKNVDALVDLVLGLVDACAASDFTGLEFSKKDVGSILNATTEILASKNLVELMKGVDRLIALSIDSAKLLEGCGCDVYGKTVVILDSAIALQDLCRKMDPGSGATLGAHDGKPIVVGLTNLLNGLGVAGRSAIVLDGIGGAEPVNKLLDSLYIGPNDERR